MAGMENWETCVFFLFLLFPLLLPSKWKGSGIWQHICNKKVHFTSKKLPHTLIQCEPRQRVNHKAYQYPAVFGEKQEVSDQLPLRKVPSVYASPGGDIVISFLFLIFRFSLRHFGKIEKWKIKGKSLCGPLGFDPWSTSPFKFFL